MAARGELTAVYSGYPWSRLKREGVAREIVRTYPYLQAPFMAAMRFGLGSFPRTVRQWEWQARSTLDRYAARTLPECDAVVALSGMGLEAGKRVQSRGGKYVCDRGSTHIRTQAALLQEEYDRWGVPWLGIDPRIIEREEAEYATADLITVPSEFNVQSFVAHGISPQKIRKIPYGANVARFQPRGGPDPNKFVVLFVGHLSLHKGIPYLLQAFEKFAHPRRELWLAGTPQAHIQQVLKQFDLSRARFLGQLNHDELAERYSRAQALVLPSVEEGLAVVQGEALACGCPVIATDNTGGSDLFTDGREGFIVPIRDPDAIAQRLTQLAEDPTLREQMSAAALARVKAIGGWHEYGASYRSCLEQLSGMSSTAPATLPPQVVTSVH